MMLSRDEREYLAGVTRRAKALRGVFDGNGGNSDQAREELAGFIGQPGRLLDLFEQCRSVYGCHSSIARRRLDWIVGEWERHPTGYPAIWDSLTERPVLAELERYTDQAAKPAVVPKDLKKLEVAAKVWGVSRSWLQTRIELGELTSHRPKDKGPHLVSMAEVEALTAPRRSE